MSRRRLRIVCSSDEEDNDFPPPPPPLPQQQPPVEEVDDVIIDDIETDFQTVTLNSLNPTPNSNNSTTTTSTTTNRYGSRLVEAIPLDISDEDQEDMTISAPTSNSISGNESVIEVSETPVHSVLEGLGLRVRREWLDSCLHGLQMSVQGFQRMDDYAKAKLCFQQFLRSDMNSCGAGVLPPNVHTLHLVDLKGPFVLQVDEIVNISNPLRERYKNAAPGMKRCLKLSMTDGIQRVFGMEYRPIRNLEVLAPAGLKIAICNVHIRHGLLMLVPEAIEGLGGSVDEFEAARQRLVNEINKPPRGKRNRTGVVPPLATRATLAAWPPRNNAAPGHVDGNPQVNTVPVQASAQGSAVSVPTNYMHRPIFTTPWSRNSAEPNVSAVPRPEEQAEVSRHTDMPSGTHFRQGANCPRKDFEVPMSRSSTESTTQSAVQPPESVTIPQCIDESTSEAMAPPGRTSRVTPPAYPTNDLPGEDVEVPYSRANDEPNTSSIHMDIEDISMLDELEHHLVLSTDEVPFTYLANLSAKCAANDDETSVVRGKIKCFLTGVKGFQYKQRTTYELRVYVDDGSLISEILIDHKVVQNRIGYSPQEVTSALASSESKRVSEMKETLKQFQIFLINFEGTMIVEMSEGGGEAVAVEMNQGCPASDAWLLLNRVKSSSAQLHNASHLNPIDLSP